MRARSTRNDRAIIRQPLLFLLCGITSLLVLLLPLVTYAEPATAGPPDIDNRPVILILGDSLSAGTGIRIEASWVSLLEKRLDEGGYRYRVVNASLNGLPTPGGLSRLPALLDQHKPTLLLLALGANDGLRGFPVTVMKDNLVSMIRLGKQANCVVLMAGIQIPLNYGPQYTQTFEKAFKEVSHSEKVAIVPSLLGNIPLDPNLMQADGLHPNAIAQPLILDIVWPHLMPFLKK